MNWYNLNETTDRELRTAVVIRTLYDRGRQPAIDAVCDAIEGFCEDACVWTKLSGDAAAFTIFAGYYMPYMHMSYVRSYKTCPKKCPYCNRRVVEQFDILKEEGV
jgi:hypothetical protein